MTHRLLVNPGTPQAWEIQLKSGPNRLGRGEHNDFPVPHTTVSGTHCEITVSSAGVILKDLASTNGTFINRAPVQEAVLQSGQHVQLGSVDMVFESAPVAAVATAVGAPPSPPPVTARLTARPTGMKFASAAAPATPAPVATPVAAEDAPPLAPPLPQPAMAPPASGAFCKFHAKIPARFYCPKCAKYFCDMCVATQPGSVHTCRQCSARVTAVQVKLQRAAGPKGFFARLPDAFFYPFRGMGIFMLMVLTVLVICVQGGGLLVRNGGVRGPAMGFIAVVLAAGYLFAYMQAVIHTTAAEDREMPDLPGVSNLWDDILVPCLQLLGMTVVCFGPAIALALGTVALAMPALAIAILPAFILGCIYFPMAFLALNILDSVMAVNPLVIVPSILRVPL